MFWMFLTFLTFHILWDKLFLYALVQFIQHAIGEQGANDPSLRCAYVSFPILPIFNLPCSQDIPSQTNARPVFDFPSDHFSARPMLNIVEASRAVTFHKPVWACPGRFDFHESGVTSSLRSKAVCISPKLWLIVGLSHES